MVASLVLLVLVASILSARRNGEAFQDAAAAMSMPSASLPRQSMMSFSAIVINLDRNRDRLLRFMTEYSRSDIASKVPIRRFPAIDAQQIDISRYVTPKTMQQIQTTLVTGYRLRHHEMTGGAVGCFLSHVSVMRMLLQDAIQDVYLIFEDDAVVPETLAGAVMDVLASAPPDWDMILLGYHYATFQKAKIPYYDESKFDCVRTFWGTHAIFVNKRGAQKIVDAYERDKISMQVDSMMSRMLVNGTFTTYATKKQLVRPGQFGSDIQVPVKHVNGINPFDLEGFLVSLRS